MRKLAKRLYKRLRYGIEHVVGGGWIREAVLVKLLQHHYRSVFRRQWKYSDEAPHFFDHRIGATSLTYDQQTQGPYFWNRGFLTSQVIRDGDSLLDIGCGDGFFTKRFFSSRCSHVDAIDVEPSAIKHAKWHNASPNIEYHLMDAVARAFPQAVYDVIVWDGALGHFSKDVTDQMFTKIAQCLAEDGIFVGSESLGQEGHDHLQFFASLEDLYQLLSPHFPNVELTKSTYTINQSSTRMEAYWRCSLDEKRLQDLHWKQFRRESKSQRSVA